MPDIENLKIGLEEVSDFFFEIHKKETDEYKVAKAEEYCNIAEEALSLLKKQEAVYPIKDIARNKRCPKCFTILKGKFCHKCGQAVKWDG